MNLKMDNPLYLGIFQERNVNIKPYGFYRKYPHLRYTSCSILRKSIAYLFFHWRGTYQIKEKIFN